MYRIVPNMAGWLANERKLQGIRHDTNYTLDSILREELPDDKLYVEDTLRTEWHRHVEQHGPKSEAYAGYTQALIELEDTLCKK